MTPVDHLPGAFEWPATDAERWRRAGYWTGQTFADLLDTAAQTHPHNIAITSNARTVTYAELRSRARGLAAGLHRLGLRRQDRVLVQLDNVTEFFDVCFALYELGAVPVFALPAHRAHDIEALLTHSRARAYIVSAVLERTDLRPLARRLQAAVDHLEFAIVVGGVGTDGPGDVDLIPLPVCVIGPEEAETILAGVTRPTPDEVAFLQLSGGSTGRPKLIPRTHDEYLYTLRESAQIAGLSEASRYLAALPIAHNYAMSSPGCFGVFAVGGTVVLSEGNDPARAFALIQRERVTIVALVPPLALMWMRALEQGAHPAELSSLQVVQVGGAPFAPTAAARVGPAFGATLQQVFGMAEGLVCYTRLDDDNDTITTTQGRPISPDDEIRIVDDNDQPLPTGSAGHLLTRGPYTIRGYYDAEAHNRVAFTSDGFYRTGDIVSQTEAGYVRVVGRAKDQINRGGEKIAVDEVEDHLLAHPCVHDAALVAMPDDVLGERSCAFVIAESDAAINRRAIAAFLTDRGVAAFKIPDRVVVVNAFPATGVGKTSKRELRELIRSHLLDAQPAGKAK